MSPETAQSSNRNNGVPKIVRDVLGKIVAPFAYAKDVTHDTLHGDRDGEYLPDTPTEQDVHRDHA